MAYWLGRGPSFALPGACHVYWEFLGPAERDADRLEAALNRLVQIHDMLRAVVGPDGQQSVLPKVPPYRIERHDWTGADAQANLEALRSTMAHETFDPATWPLWRVAFSRDGTVSRLHLSVDLLIVDVPSLAVLIDDWAALESDPAAPVVPPAVSFRDYVLHRKALEGGPAHEAARAHWEAHGPALPPPPP